MILPETTIGLHKKFIRRLNTILPPDKTFYHVDINEPNSLIIFASGLEKPLDENVNLLLNAAFEGYQSIISSIYNRLVIGKNIDESKIWLVSGAADIQKLVETHARNINRKPINTIFTVEFEHMMGEQAYVLQYEDSASLKAIHNKKNKTYKKSFLCLNRRWRIHRPTLVTMMGARQLLDYGYVSLTEFDHKVKWNIIYDSILETHKRCPEIYDYFLNNKELITSQKHLTLDQPILDSPKTNALTSELDYFYENSYFSVVTETNYYSNVEHYSSAYVPVCEATRFFSEKVFKPMVYKHPFVLVSVPNSLELLRELGYKTFHPYINEDYDKEQNDCTRLLMLLDEIERLSKLSKDELDNFIDKTSEICDHNYTWLLKRSNLIQ